MKRNKPRYPGIGFTDLVAILEKIYLYPFGPQRAQLLFASGEAPFSGEGLL